MGCPKLEYNFTIIQDDVIYYLKSRYYDSEVGRFISMDDVDEVRTDIPNGLNLYAYCGNNPVMNIDPTGHSFWNWLQQNIFNPIGNAFVSAGVWINNHVVQPVWHGLQHTYNWFNKTSCVFQPIYQ